MVLHTYLCILSPYMYLQICIDLLSFWKRGRTSFYLPYVLQLETTRYNTFQSPNLLKKGMIWWYGKQQQNIYVFTVHIQQAVLQTLHIFPWHWTCTLIYFLSTPQGAYIYLRQLRRTEIIVLHVQLVLPSTHFEWMVPTAKTSWEQSGIEPATFGLRYRSRQILLKRLTTHI